MLAAPSGAAGFIARHHSAVLSAMLSLVGIVTGTAAVLGSLEQVAWIDVAALGFSAVLAATIAFWQTRHLTLAILTAATPLLGLVWAAPLSAGSGFAAVPFLAYGFGVAVAILYAQLVLDRVLSQVEGEAPWRAAGVVLGLFAVLGALWFRRTGGADAALQSAGDAILASLSVLLLPLMVPLLRFDEAYVARANRTRERRARAFERLGGAAIPRWGLALSGIVLIFLALGWFGTESDMRAGWWRTAITVMLAGGVFGALAGGWRESLGLALVAGVVCLVALWWRGYDARLPYGAVNVLQSAMLASFLVLRGARHMRNWRRAGDLPEMVRRRALEDSSGAVFAAMGAAAAALPSCLHAGAPVIVLCTLFAGLAGAILLPVLLTGIETLLPRRRSVDEVFGKKK